MRLGVQRTDRLDAPVWARRARRRRQPRVVAGNLDTRVGGRAPVRPDA
jgi:hypothetical protein